MSRISRSPSHARYSSSGFTLIEVLVALSILALGVAGVAKLRLTAYQHIGLTQEIQQASYFADTHLTSLGLQKSIVAGFQTGEYSRGESVEGYPWQLLLSPLTDDVLQPESTSLSDKVRPISADLLVWVDRGVRELRFHTLILAEPLTESEQPSLSRPTFKLAVTE
ncbi:MAG: prepilin-type N-terminal cleavage/methylation domain-containing protein [Arenicella sp.]|nr:prepilin-type N-terminal cleavage/methylation domain-containing protein [Arenicella sp.]